MAITIDELFEDLDYMDSDLNQKIKSDSFTPLDVLIDRENKQELVGALSGLSHHELVVVLMMNYENEKRCHANTQVRDYFKKEKGLNLSRYKVYRIEKTGLSKLRRNLKFKCGWEI